MITNRLNAFRRNVPNLVIAQRVVDKMAKAASRYIQDETGEAMVGLLIPGTHTNGVPTLYVLDTIAPDESAVREWGTFQQGDERQDELIWWLQENWRVSRQKKRDAAGRALSDKWDAPLRYLGDWHKQPGFMIQPSQGDLMTARSWIDDPDNGMDFLLAPIATLGHPSADVANSEGTNFIAVSQGDDTSMRVDFWYLDQHIRDFMPIIPTIYPDEQLPRLAEYPWHLTSEARFNDEYERLEKDGLFASLTLWDAGENRALDVCILTARMGAEKVVILVTPWNYPASAPTARLAPYRQIEPDDDLYEVFEGLWKESTPVTNPPGWEWAEDKRLIDYVHAIEKANGLKQAEAAPTPTPAPATDAPAKPETTSTQPETP